MLATLEGLVVLDEIQMMPELFSVLRVLVDRPENRARFLILGSASPDIVKNVSETLAGRVEFVELSGFDIAETGADASPQRPPEEASDDLERARVDVESGGAEQTRNDTTASAPERAAPSIKAAGLVALLALMACAALPVWVFLSTEAERASRIGPFKTWLLAASLVYFVAGSLWVYRRHDEASAR